MMDDQEREAHHTGSDFPADSTEIGLSAMKPVETTGESVNNTATEVDDPGANTLTATDDNGQGECFDASQYAFFGGNVSTEVELGGLGDDDDGDLEPTDDVYDGADPNEESLHKDDLAHTSTGASAVDDLASSFAKLGDSPWDGLETAHEGAVDSASIPQHDVWAHPVNLAPIPGSLDSIRQWWDQPAGQPASSLSQQLEPFQTQSPYAGASSLAPPGQLPLQHGQQVSSQLRQHQQQPQQWWDEANRVEAGQQAPLPWQLQQYEQQLQQQQQQSRNPALISAGAQRMPYTLSLEELEASLSLQAARSDYSLDSSATSSASPAGRLPPSLAAYSAGLPGQAQHTYGGPGAYRGGNTYLPPQLPGQQGQWPPTATSGMQVPGHLAQHPQGRTPYLPPQLLQPIQRGGQSQSASQQLYQGGHVASLDAYETLDSQQRYDTQRSARGSSFAESLGHSRQAQQLPAGMRSKYMSAEELDAIVRIQWAATHASEPYSDDYYHQAMQAKHAAATGTPHGRRHFAPSNVREANSHGRSSAERQHLYLPVEGLGRVPLSSIRRPRPLLEVESGYGLGAERAEGSLQRPLEQEPMLAARIAIEDGMCLLLDVDDIDRLLLVAHTQSPETVAHLRRRRQLLLEGLAASLQLSDPLAPGSGVAHLHDAAGRNTNGRAAGGPRDDLVFLRLVSLPKGRKLLARYLLLLPPGSELQRVVVMAVFRHLRFLFGGIQSESGSSGGLAEAVAEAVGSLALPGLTACLAAVAVAPEQPPLRSIGSGGDGATLVLRALLDRATAARNQVNVAPQQQGAWQAAFDVFFGRLSKTLCFESILNSLPLLPQTAQAVSKEMPLELLRAALPHTSQAQREQVGALLQGLLHTA